MGKPTGFLEYERKESVGEAPLKRIKHFNEFHTPLSKKEQERQGARCMNCGVPFCQSGILIKGMVTTRSTHRKNSRYRRFRTIRTLRSRILKPSWTFCNSI